MDEKKEQRSGISRPFRHKDVFLFAHPRTASNLLGRLLSAQPGWIQSGYHIRPALKFARENFNWDSFTDISEEHRQGYYNLLRAGIEQIEDARDAAIAEDKSLFIKNHTFHLWEPSLLSQSMWGGEFAQALLYNPRSSKSPTRTNPTFLPDDFLASWLPIFSIRHPALTFESWYRAETRVRPIDILDKTLSPFTTFRWSRLLHDWYLSQEEAYPESGYSKPVVIDADDIIEKRSIDKLCELCGMDLSSILYEWEVTAPREGPIDRGMSFMETLWNSTSIDQSKSAQGLDLMVKREQWKDEFGPTVADALYEFVEKAMPDYNYLLSRKI